MRLSRNVASCVLAALVAASCGGDQAPAPTDTTPQSEPGSEPESANRPPLIDALEVEPRQPRTGEPIVLAIKARDPDGDSIDVVVDWYRNGALAEEGGTDRLDTSGFRRGDEIYAVVRVSDGSEEVTLRSGNVRIANSPARVTSLELFPANPKASDTLMVEAKAVDADGDSYELHYRWRVNGEELQDMKTSSLPPNRTKRGDELEVSVAADDGQGLGEWYVAQPLRMQNALPSISSAPGRELATPTRYEYQIKASDPDGDHPLRYRLVQGPPGMQVDLVSGIVSWDVPEAADGKYNVEVAVSDSYGGETRQAYTLEFHWEAVPAAPAASSKGEAEAEPGAEKPSEVESPAQPEQGAEGAPED